MRTSFGRFRGSSQAILTKAFFRVSRKSFIFQHAAGEKFADHYELKDQLGSGNYGTVYTCVHKDSGDVRAVKILKKSHIKEDAYYNEIDTLKEMDHPNILKVYESFEDDKNYFLVTEFCNGGELFEEIIEWGKFTEEDAAVLMRQILACVNYCHKRNVVHRDLKPENILLEKDKGFDQLRICDFGTAKMFADSDADAKVRMKDSVGSPYYIAPEVLAGNYGPKCDVWSCGVIAYIVLSGVPPFNGHSDDEIYDHIEEGVFDFDHEAWDDISESAMDFISLLLTYEEEDRPSAAEALQHPWIDTANQAVRASYKQKDAISSLKNLRAFNAQQQLKAATYTFIATQLLTKNEKEKIDSIFRAMDSDCDGKLSKEEIKRGYNNHFGTALSDVEIDLIFDRVDTDLSGEIEYSEFVMATVNEKNMLSKSRLEAAFKAFDKDGNGMISPDEVRDILGGGGAISEEAVDKIIAQVDENGDGEISFDEFTNMMLQLGMQ